MKAKREHQVPLSDAALALLESMPKDSDADVVFAGTKGQPLSDMSLTAVIRRMNGDDKPVWADANGDGITVHGFRSSFRMWAAERPITRVRLPNTRWRTSCRMRSSVPISAVRSSPSVPH
jgi:integrase